jgi:hypothetical protein
MDNGQHSIMNKPLSQTSRWACPVSLWPHNCYCSRSSVSVVPSSSPSAPLWSTEYHAWYWMDENRDYTQASALWMSRGFRSYHTLNGIINLTVEALSVTCPTFYNSHYKPPWLYPITFSSMGRWYRWNGQYNAEFLSHKCWVLSAAMKRNRIELRV